MQSCSEVMRVLHVNIFKVLYIKPYFLRFALSMINSVFCHFSMSIALFNVTEKVYIDTVFGDF